jgi:hypothetical protein
MVLLMPVVLPDVERLDELAPLRDGLYLPERVLTVTGRHALLWGRQHGIDRHLLIERVAPIGAAERSNVPAALPVLRRLSHIGWPQCLDVFAEDNALYIVTVTGEGTPLALLDEPLSPQLAVEVGIHLCNALNYLHGIGQHSSPLSVQPETVFLTRANRARITNLAEMIGIAEYRACRSSADEAWNVGCTMHHALTRWRGNHRKGAPAVGSLRIDVPAELLDIIARALSRSLSRRFADCAALRQALVRLQASDLMWCTSAFAQLCRR